MQKIQAPSNIQRALPLVCNRLPPRLQPMGMPMPRYYFHLRSKDRFVWDEEGVDLPDPAAARGAADKFAAELRGGLLHESKIACCWTVAVTDEGDQLVHVTAL